MALQRAVLDLIRSADDSCVLDQSFRGELVLNPHLWSPSDMRDIWRKPSKQSDIPWTTKEDSLVMKFEERFPGMGPGDLRLGYHGARNANKVSHIIFEGLNSKFRRKGLTSAYFGSTLAACKQYGDVILFVVPKVVWDGTTRGDGAFRAQEHDVLPVGAYVIRSKYTISNLLNDRFPGGGHSTSCKKT